MGERKRTKSPASQHRQGAGASPTARRVAHDFNNLMTAIIGFAELAMNDLPEDSPVRADLEEVRATAARAVPLAHQLVSLAASETAAQVRERGGAPASRVVRQDLPTGSETVLLVEDETSVRRLAARVLRGLGYAVIEAVNGRDALNIAHERDEYMHLVVTDVIMPQMGGRELADQITSLRPETKILYMSGYIDDDAVLSRVFDQSIDFLQKPFTPGALARKVREVLDRE